MKIRTSGIGITLVIAILLSLSAPACAAGGGTADEALAETGAYLCQTVSAPQVGSVGGEWAVLGLARSGYAVPDGYFENYYAGVEEYVKARSGILDARKYTEYARVILALTAIGKDPAQVAGYDLLTPLGDYDKTVWQGVNGPIWALIALDSGGYPMPQNPDAATQATRQMYVDRILALQLPDGGWSLSGGAADPNLTGMALQALAKYQDQAAVAAATGKALACMSARQDAAGGFASGGTEDSESAAQMVVALTELGIPLDDARFVKNGSTTADNLMTFYVAGGGFRHTAGDTGPNQMATEQGFYALAAILRARDGKNSLYRMTDAAPAGAGSAAGQGEGLAGKDPAVRAVPAVSPGVTFDDVAGSPDRAAVEALAARGIITGKPDGGFDPDATMTRAEFAAIVVRALGLTPQANGRFSDVGSTAWFAPCVGTAYTFGLVNGTSQTTFSPNGVIARQEAAVMVARAAKLCGMNTAYDAASTRDVLAQFSDYMQSADWARSGLAFCYDQGILDDAAVYVRPGQSILRGEVAQMLYQLLSRANLLE